MISPVSVVKFKLFKASYTCGDCHAITNCHAPMGSKQIYYC